MANVRFGSGEEDLTSPLSVIKLLELPRGFYRFFFKLGVATVGMLSAVVLTSLASARNKGADAAIKSNLSGARSKAEIFYNANNMTYDDVCTTTSATRIGDSVNAAERAYGITPTAYLNTTASTWNTVSATIREAAGQAWALLKASTGAAPVGWCVDASGASRQVTTVLGASIYVCP